MSGIGQRIKEFGLENYPSLTEFAGEMGMSLASLSQYFSGKREPGLKIFLRIEKLGCSMDWLLTGKIKGNELVNKYPIYDNMKFNELIDEIVLPYHKIEGMYCLYMDYFGHLVPKKKLSYFVLLIDSKRSVKLGDAVVVLEQGGQSYFGTLLQYSEGNGVVMPKNDRNRIRFIDKKSVNLVNRVSLKLTKYDANMAANLRVVSASIIE